VPNIKALLPYMDEFWRESFVARGIDGFDMMSYPLGAPITCRPDWRVKGERPGSSLPNMRRDALDAFGISLAICNPLTGGQVAVSETMGAAICSAVNDWIIEHWLNKEPRLRASIVVPAQAPLLAADEIERRAGDKRVVQVMLPAACEMMLGRSYYWPIYAAAAKYDLPIGLHAGSMYRYAPTSGGWPSHYLHDYVANSQLFEDQLLSLISNGVFNRWPDLRFVLIESGVTWLPAPGAIKTWRARAGGGSAEAVPADDPEYPPDRNRSTRRAVPMWWSASSNRSTATACCCSPRTIRTGSSRAMQCCPADCRPLCCNGYVSTIRWKPILA
jgi:predicted TIM-barrel fold metal-dependent hydrolase